MTPNLWSFSPATPFDLWFSGRLRTRDSKRGGFRSARVTLQMWRRNLVFTSQGLRLYGGLYAYTVSVTSPLFVDITITRRSYVFTIILWGTRGVPGRQGRVLLVVTVLVLIASEVDECRRRLDLDGARTGGVTSNNSIDEVPAP